MEVVLRKLIPKLRLYNYPFLIAMYEKYALVRYSKKFDRITIFRGAKFIIGKDVTLFPSVFLGSYESMELDILLSYDFPEDLVFWDIGANVGLYSVLIGMKYPNSRVVAFEPNIHVLSLLKQNLFQNNLTNFTIEEVALSNQVGTGELLSQESRPGAGKLDLDYDKSKDDRKLRVLTGEEFLKTHPALVPNLVKIDVEGHEPEVIEGMLKIIRDYKPMLTLEVFMNLWEGDRYLLWESTITRLFEIYEGAALVSDGKSRRINSWSQNHLTGGMQTLIFS
jgi:FkbM family methyltransferase